MRGARCSVLGAWGLGLGMCHHLNQWLFIDGSRAELGELEVRSREEPEHCHVQWQQNINRVKIQRNKSGNVFVFLIFNSRRRLT